MHTATASVKSSSDSIPVRSLAGITEDAGELGGSKLEKQGSIKKTQQSTASDRDTEDLETRGEDVNRGASAKHKHKQTPSIASQHSLQRARTVSGTDKALPPIPKEKILKNVVDARERISIEKITPRSVPDQSDYETKPGTGGRVSSQSARPSSRDLYDASGYKQKVKLGPRPSTESTSRPDNSDRFSKIRPVATLPAGLRMPSRKATHQKMDAVRPQSQQSQRTFASGLSQRDKVPMAPVTPIQIPDREVPLVYKGILTPAKTPVELNSPNITPEKRRLMKALQLRQKQLAAQKSRSDVGTETTPSESEATKSNLDDSMFSATNVASIPETDPDMIHVAVRGLSKEELRNIEASPISIPETSDGPSTQASSVTDEEELEIQDKKMRNPDESIKPSQNHGTSSINSGNHDLHEASGQEKVRSPPESHEVSIDTRVFPNQPALNPTVQQSLIVKEGSLEEETDSGGEFQRRDREDHSPIVQVVNSRENSTRRLEKPDDKVKPTIPSTDLPTVGETTFAIKRDSTSSITRRKDTGSQRRRQSIEQDIVPTQGTEVFTPSDGNEIQPVSQGIPSKASESLPQLDAFESHGPPLADSDMSIGSVADDISSGYQAADPAKSLSAPFSSNSEIEDSNSTRHEHPPAPYSDPLPSNTQLEFLSPRLDVKRQSQDIELTATRSSAFDTVSKQHEARQVRRHGMIDPQQRVSSPEHSDEQFLSDDSFMEELKSATLQEAKPISVSKSPIKPVFSRSDSDQRFTDLIEANRSVSSPLDQLRKDEETSPTSRLPTSLSSRSVSASHAPRPDSERAAPSMPKKLGVSSGISQRIKALEQLSSRPKSPLSLAQPNTSTRVSQRKTSFRNPVGASGPIIQNDNRSRPNSAYPSPSPSPETVKSNPFNNLNQIEHTRPESVSVTATIVRTPRTKTPETPLNPTESRAIDLHRSPLIVEHQKMMPPALSPLKPPRPSYARYSSARSGSSSSTEQKTETPQTVRRGSFASIVSRSSRNGSEAELPRSLSDSSIIGITRNEDREDKKDSKRSRLMKRMSSISSISRRSIANALNSSPKEAPIIEHQEPIPETRLKSIEVGDVNVQFPDTLVSLPGRMR